MEEIRNYYSLYNIVNTQKLTDCPANVDEVWNIQWPFVPAGTSVTVSCGVDFVGMANNNTYTHSILVADGSSAVTTMTSMKLLYTRRLEYMYLHVLTI